MAVHFLIATLFHVGWGIYMIGETSRMGSQSPAACEFKDDSESLEGPCSGFGAGAAFAMFAAVSAFVAAALAKRGPLSWYPFIGSLALYTIAKVSETGGQSQYFCHDDVDIKELCDGYSSASVFYFFAFAASLAVLLLIWKMAELRHFAISAFFAYLALFSIGLTSEIGGGAANACESAKDADDDSIQTQCSGLSFATFLGVVCMVTGAVFAALAFIKKDTGSTLWLGGSVFLAVYFLAWTSVAGTSANVNCDAAEDNDDDATQAQCSGHGAATFWYLLATIAALLATFFSVRNHDGFKQATFLAGFSLFFLGYVSFYGGESSANCQVYEEFYDDDDTYFAQAANNTCGGYGAASFFGFVSFAILLAAAILTQTARGAPTAEEGDNADASAPQEKDVPVATAVPVGEAREKDGANV